jgi:HYR domain
VVEYSGSSASDIVGGSLGTDCEPASGSTFALGETTVTCSAVDSSLNVGTATFDVTVQDTTAPVVTVPADLTVGATSAAGAAVTFTSTAEDAVDGAITPTCAPASGSTFARNVTTTVTCTATDLTSHTGTSTFDVRVDGTVLSQDANIGDMLAEVDISDGFAAGDYAVIDPGQSDQEVRYIKSIGSLDFEAPFASFHAAGTLVQTIAPPQGDTAAPVISVTAPAPQQRVTKGSSLSAAFTCTDSGVGEEGCVGTAAAGTGLDTSTVGTHTLTVTSWDFNGNATTKTVSYVVVAAAPLAFTGATPGILIPAAVLLLLLGAAAVYFGTRRRRGAHRA